MKPIPSFVLKNKNNQTKQPSWEVVEIKRTPPVTPTNEPVRKQLSSSSHTVHRTPACQEEATTGEQSQIRSSTGKLMSISPNLSRDMDKIDRGLETVWLLGEDF